MDTEMNSLPAALSRARQRIVLQPFQVIYQTGTMAWHPLQERYCVEIHEPH